MSETLFLDIVGFIFIALSFGWNAVQLYVFVQEKFRPPEEKEQFDGQKALMLQELYNDMIDGRGAEDYDVESGTILRRIESHVNALHTMHDRTDDNGVRLWYVPRGMCRDIASVLRILREVRRGGNNPLTNQRHRRSSSDGEII